ncbi:MAG: hypothetical protein Q9218_000007 [Villophora microphyllina]
MATACRISSPKRTHEQTRCTLHTSDSSKKVTSRTSLSRFETIIATHQPVWASLLLHLPTSAILGLYHSSQYLRSFLKTCPTAWSALSFRRLSAVRTLQRYRSPASDSSGEVSNTATSKPYALDRLLVSIVIPCGTCIRSMELDSTGVSGHTLISIILPARRGTLQHLSVRGCKNVSLKYHILPYLELYKLRISVGLQDPSKPKEPFALKSLYTFRCRHHRRRPYLAASLLRKDSDAKPTHDFVKICQSLGIWIDTAWCPTPGGRCSRRREYFSGRGLNDFRNEVWVVFDRLWRSGNRVGRLTSEEPWPSKRRGQLWQDNEYGFEGEALGTEDGSSIGEGKLVASHLRQSYKNFVDDYECNTCGDRIPERCEQCCITMHCMGCRKTLCASCAYSKPLPQPKASPQTLNSSGAEDGGEDALWWAPIAARNPNSMDQESASEGLPPPNQTQSSKTPPIQTSWCCLKPQCSISGSISLVGPGITPDEACRLRAVPLPQGQVYEDSDFNPAKQISHVVAELSRLLNTALREGRDPMLVWLLCSTGGGQPSMCPRNLCSPCLEMTNNAWRTMCQFCRETICFAHDVRGFKARLCGYRDLSLEDRVMKEDMLRVAQAALKRKQLQIKAMDRITEYLQEHGTLDEHHEHELALVTELPSAGDDEDLQELENLTVNDFNNFTEQINTAPRKAFAALPFRQAFFNRLDRRIKVLDSWRGCASFICPEMRSTSDFRRKCSASVLKCIECKVHVCPDCWKKDPPCDCSYCKDNYHCPRCFITAGIEHCKKVEETERRLHEEEAERRRLAEEYQTSNQIAEHVGDFFAGMDAPS